MKRAIVASILGLAASGIAAFGQGTIVFNNYLSSNYNSDTVMWGAGSGHTVGTQVDTASVTVQLFYALGNVSSDTTAQFLAAATAGNTAPISTSINSGGSYGGGHGPGGYYSGGNQLINGWASGPVTFAVEAWDTTTGATYAAAAVKGISALFVAQDDTTGAAGRGVRPSALPAEDFANMAGVTLTAVPEPTTLAFAGMGMLSLLALARRKNV